MGIEDYLEGAEAEVLKLSKSMDPYSAHLDCFEDPNKDPKTLAAHLLSQRSKKTPEDYASLVNTFGKRVPKDKKEDFNYILNFVSNIEIPLPPKVKRSYLKEDGRRRPSFTTKDIEKAPRAEIEFRKDTLSEGVRLVYLMSDNEIDKIPLGNTYKTLK